MSCKVLVSDISRTNLDVNTGTNMYLTNGDGNIIVKAEDELSLNASKVSIDTSDLTFEKAVVVTAPSVKFKGAILDTDNGAGVAGDTLTRTALGAKWLNPLKSDGELKLQGSKVSIDTSDLTFEKAVVVTAPSVKFKGSILDTDNGAGVAGDTLTRTALGAKWLNPLKSDGELSLKGSKLSIDTSDLTFEKAVVVTAPSVKFKGAILDSDNGAGVEGETLTRTALGAKWSNPLNTPTVSIGTGVTTDITLGRTGQTATCESALKLKGTLKDINGDNGTSGQMLTSTGSGVEWVAPCSLLDVTTQGNTTDQNLVVSNDSKTGTYKNDSIVFTSAMTLTAPSIKLNGDLLDSNGASGVAGTVLTKVAGNKYEWLSSQGAAAAVAASAVFDTATVSIGTTSATSTITLGRTGGTVSVPGSLHVNGSLLDSDGSMGQDGEYLKHVGSKAKWVTPPDVLNTSTVSIGGTSDTSTITIGRTGVQTTCLGTLRVPGSLQVNGSLLDSDGSMGQDGYYLKSNGLKAKWTALAAPNILDNNLVNIGTTDATSLVILGRSTGGDVVCPGKVSVGSLQLNAVRIGNDLGTNGQVLGSTGTGVTWVTPAGNGLTSSLVSIGTTDTSTTINIGRSGMIATCFSNLKIRGSLLDSSSVDGSPGALNNVLMSTGTGVKWGTVPDSLNTATVNIATALATTTCTLGRDLLTVNCYSKLWLRNSLIDSFGSSGSNGFVLSSSDSKTLWVKAPDVSNTPIMNIGTSLSTIQVNIGTDSIPVSCPDLSVKKLNGGGTSGQVLTSSGPTSAPVWKTAGGLDVDQLKLGTTPSTTSITMGRTGQVVTCDSDLKLKGRLLDAVGGGSIGNVLTSTGTGVQWENILERTTVKIATTSGSNAELGRSGGNVSCYSNLLLGTFAVPSELTLYTKIKDSAGNFATSDGMALLSSSQKVLWKAIPIAPSASTVVNSGMGLGLPYNNKTCEIVFVTSAAGSATGKQFLLPSGTAPPVGYTIYYTNLSAAEYTVKTEVSDGCIITKSTTSLTNAIKSVVVPVTTINLEFVYYGSCNDGVITRRVWACNI